MGYELKQKTFEVLEAKSGGNLTRIVSISLISLIWLNFLVFVLETDRGIFLQYRTSLLSIEIFSVTVFTIEYFLRLWSCTVDSRFKHPLWGRLRFAITPLALVDFLALVPFYLPIVFPDLLFIRLIRLGRLLRLFKLTRYFHSIKTLVRVLQSKKQDLEIVLFILLILLLCSSTLVYLAEHEAQPENFPSIPASLWWAVVTLTTIGYGDVYPITPLGRLLGALTAILGVGLFTLPSGMIASGFVEQIQKKQAEPKVCPHCGKDIHHSAET